MSDPTLPDNLPYYLTGTSHWHSKGMAVVMAKRHVPALAVKDEDGTWSVYELSATPRQSGQPLFRRPTREHFLFEVQ